MPSKSNLKISKIQLADGTQVSGSDLDTLLEDMVDRFNSVLPTDIQRKYAHSVYVGGYIPAPHTSNNQGELPWLPVINNTAVTTPASGYQNKFRNKGFGQPDINVEIPLGMQYAWTNSMYFAKPVILRGLSIFLMADAAYPNDFIYGAVPPPSKTVGASLDDFVFELTVDNTFVAENRKLNDLEIQKVKFKLNSHSFSRMSPTGYTDMQPAHPYPLNGVYIEYNDLIIPLHRDSRVRFSQIIPQYVLGQDSGWTKGSGELGENQYYSWSLTVLEPLEAE